MSMKYLLGIHSNSCSYILPIILGYDIKYVNEMQSKRLFCIFFSLMVLNVAFINIDERTNEMEIHLYRCYRLLPY